MVNKHITKEDYNEENFSINKLKIIKEMKQVMNIMKSKNLIATSWGALKPFKSSTHLKSLFIRDLKTNLKKISKIPLTKRNLKNIIRTIFQPFLTKLKISSELDLRVGRIWEYSHLIEHLNIKPNSVILDAGGSSTPIVFYLGFKKHKVYTVDLTKELVDNSNKVSKIMGWNIIAKQADLTQLPFENNTFDYIICVSVLEHMSHALKTKGMKEFERVLKPGGLIGLTFDYGEIDDTTSGTIKTIDEIFKILIYPTNLKIYGNQKLVENRRTMKLFGRGYSLYALFLQKM